MDVMYKVKPIFCSEEIVLPDNMYYVKPIGDVEPFDLIKSSNKSCGNQVDTKLSTCQSNSVTNCSVGEIGKGKENKLSNEKKTPADKMVTCTKEGKDGKPGKKSKKGKNSGSEQGKESGQSKGDGQSLPKKSQDDSQESNQGDGKDDKKDGGNLIPPVADVPYLGNIIGNVIVHDIAIQADFDYKPLRVLKVINHLRKNFGLKIAVKVHVSSTVLVESETNVDEWKMFETFESTILPRQDNQLFVTLIVKRFTTKEAWLNKQPFMVLDPHLGTAIYGEVNIARHVTRLASKFCPLCYEIYPEDDSSQVESVKDIDETLNEIQKFLFIRNLGDKQARPSIPEIKDKRLKDGVDLKLTLDYILLLSLKL
ncbi:uncharacterized protein LOC128389333 [Panonychus citri]|uniref:uncharacterized protein LOC128389333 n=1 Tax=Panonychus citri TaxID=50023 RepID=UPI002306E6E2|nr:uncharacterized protein LOC128389333 [Panonychus citri]